MGVFEKEVTAKREREMRERAEAQSQNDPESRVIIRVRDLWKSFGKKTVLHEIDLDIEEGKTTVIIGASGSGKSVFVKHLIGLMKPDKGQIFVDGEDIVPLPLSKMNVIRKKFGMCFQMAALFDSMTVEENVAFPLVEHTKLPYEAIQKQASEILAAVGLHQVEHLYPSELSGGMRKRVGLARAIILRPHIVIYDEPTTGLDPLLTEEIDSLILSTKERFQITSIVISHDIGSIFRIADRIAMIHFGHLIFCGTPQELLECAEPEVQRFITTFG